jgi:multimeric flavodoxin WrbA
LNGLPLTILTLLKIIGRIFLEAIEMKVMAFNGSPRLKSNTFQLLQMVESELKAEGIKTELVQLGKMKLQPCKACYRCVKSQNKKCMGIRGDGFNEMYAKILDAEGLILGSPTWFSNVSGYAKTFIDRVGLVSFVNGMTLNRKVGAAVVAVRRAGAVPTFDGINHFFLMNGVIVPGSSYWNLGIGRDPGEVQKDEEGIRTMENLGKNMAWLLKKLHG